MGSDLLTKGLQDGTEVTAGLTAFGPTPPPVTPSGGPLIIGLDFAPPPPSVLTFGLLLEYTLANS